MSRITILTEKDLRAVVKLDLSAVNCVEQAFGALATKAVAMPPILRLDIPEFRGEVDVKTAYVPGFDGFAIKVSPGFFDNPRLGLPSLNGLMILFSARTGLVEALLLDNGYLTDVRTAAAGAVAARHLARKDASVATVFGAGMQARLQLEALTLVRSIKAARIWARNRDKAEKLANDFAREHGIEVSAVADPQAAVRNADIIVTTTPAEKPILRADWLEQGQHLTAMGSDAEHKNEIDPAVFARVRYVADRLTQTRILGELHHAIAAGYVERDQPFAELGEVIAGKSQGRLSNEDITFADLTGTGVQDTAIANLAFARAKDAGSGQVIDKQRKNGRRSVSVTLNFTREEYAARLAKTRKAMESAGIDLLVVTDPSNMHWLTGYDGWSFYVHQSVLVPPDGEPIWYGRKQDANGARRTAYLAHDNIIGYPDHYVQSTERHPMDLLSQIIEERGWSGLAVGVEMDNYYFSAAAFASLNKHLPNARFKDAAGLVNWQRAVKSPTELDYMRKAGKIVELMHKRIVDVVEPGMRKCDLVAEIYDAGIRGTAEFGGDYPAIVPLLPSGADASAPHLTWDDKPMRSGEGTFFEIAGAYRRYHCPLSRTVFLGKPTKAFLDAEKATLEGMEAGLSAAKPGNTCEDIANAFFAVLKKYGIIKDNRTGYPIGLSYPPDWGERTMSLRPGDRTELKPGMTFHFMTGLWLEDMGLEITESIAITDTGVECLSNVPRQLFVKG
ncbi:UNVERIFIED_ORG: ectoine utilization protein EutD/ectoine utilization protein EutC [Rhizobium sp. SORGH_AS260]|nr:ectoine utilization protein EutD/ectoine utilization protein EutC [Rhizobium sp. SORGH_AS_0260]